MKYQHDPGSGLNSVHKSHKSANRPQCDGVDVSSVLFNGTMKRGEANSPQCDGVDISSVLKNGTMKRGKANSRINNDATDGASCIMMTGVVNVSLNHQQHVLSSTTHLACLFAECEQTNSVSLLMTNKFTSKHVCHCVHNDMLCMKNGKCATARYQPHIDTPVDKQLNVNMRKIRAENVWSKYSTGSPSWDDISHLAQHALDRNMYEAPSLHSIMMSLMSHQELK